MDWEEFLQEITEKAWSVRDAYKRQLRLMELGGTSDLGLMCRLSNANALLAALSAVAKSALKDERPIIVGGTGNDETP